MIPYDFEYYKPESIEEAVEAFFYLYSNKKNPIYYGGGTEIISMSRAYNIFTEAVIDIKGIPDCNVHLLDDNCLIIGSALTLTSIAENNLFPLLSLSVKRIADHTIQDKITIGGNIAGTIIYKEAVLPLLLTESIVTIAGYSGIKKVPIKDIFNKGIQLNPGDLIVNFIINKKFITLPYLHSKRTKIDKIDYPLVTLAAINNNSQINIAFSGLCNYPFRSDKFEHCLNDNNIPINKRIDIAMESISNEIQSDLSGSADYRKFKLRSMLAEVFQHFEGVK